MPASSRLDPAAEALRARYPAYRIWHVPAAGGRRAYWTAQPARYLWSPGARTLLRSSSTRTGPGGA